MSSFEKYAKLLALAVLYEKEEQSRLLQVQNIVCRPEDVSAIVGEISDSGFRDWVLSVSHLFRSA